MHEGNLEAYYFVPWNLATTYPVKQFPLHAYIGRLLFFTSKIVFVCDKIYLYIFSASIKNKLITNLVFNSLHERIIYFNIFLNQDSYKDNYVINSKRLKVN